MSEVVFSHALRFYNLLVEHSTPETLAGSKTTANVFRGKLTDVYKEAKISGTHYGIILDTMSNAKCITVVERGVRYTPSVVVLHRPPRIKDFEEVERKPLTSPRVAATILSQRVSDLERNIGGINIGQALGELQDRIATLEREVANGKTTQD